MATTDNINEHMTRLRLKMMEQKIAKEKERRRSSSEEDHSDTSKVKLQQALLKRQSLLDRIRMTEQSLNDYVRQRSHSADNRKDLQSSPRSQSRRSLPERTRSNQVTLSPIEKPPTMKYIDPPIIHQPTYITQPPVVMKEPQQKWGKSDYMEMMMMENAQLHQHMMRQMMYQSLQPQQQRNNSPKFTIPLIPYQQQPQMLTVPQEQRRPPSVHHHHYTTPQYMEQPRPYINHVTQLPPLERQRTPRAASVRTLPAEIEPLRQPKVREPPQARPPTKPSPIPPPPAPVKKHPFPGSRLLRKLRHIFYAAWFIAFLKSEVKKNKRPTSKFLFGIKLKEAVAALHRIYLNPDGKIFPILSDAVGDGAIDLSVDVGDNGRPSTDDKQAFQELVYIIENITYNITEIMPDTGVLGTHRKAAVYELIKDGQQFPNGYFWQIERDLLEFDQDDATKNIGDKEAFILLLGIFISRSLVTTLMMKPLDYGLSTTLLGTVAEKNLRLLATLFIYIVRKACVLPTQPPLPMPFEISSYLHSDDEMKTTYTKLKKNIDYAEGLFRDWGEEFVKRLRSAGPPAGPPDN